MASPSKWMEHLEQNSVLTSPPSIRDTLSSSMLKGSSSDGMYNGFVETTYCRGAFVHDPLETNYKKCEFQFTINSKKYAITIKELINQKWIFAPRDKWFYKISD